MRESLYIGECPCDEYCVPIGNPKQRTQTRIFRDMCERVLEAQFGNEVSCGLAVKSNSHDFGTYFSVEVTYNDDDEMSMNQAFWLESYTPSEWDAKAIEALKEANVPLTNPNGDCY